MAKSYKKLRDKLTNEQQKEAREKAERILFSLKLAELRKQCGIKQADLAQSLNIKQPTLSKIENGHDIKLATLLKYIEAMGGKLELVAHMPDKDYQLTK